MPGKQSKKKPTSSAAQPAILAIDQGTTSSRAIVFDTHAQVVSVAQQEFKQHYPADGWVEHSPDDIWQTSLQVAQQAFRAAEGQGYDIKTLGITNQRETTIAWQRSTGKPIYNAIVWQDRRTAERCNQLKAQGKEAWLTERTGLLLDPYFSATKMQWILDNVDGARALAEKGDLLLGTVDSYLLWHLTGGEAFYTDITNASRTNLFNIVRQEWDEELLQLFSIPRQCLPEVLECTADFGTTSRDLFGKPIPIGGMAGDQQAATVGQCCFAAGDIKSTYGTGCFVMMNTGESLVHSQHRLLSTIAYRINGVTHYALEGSIFIAGAAVQWLRDNLKTIDHAAQTQAHAEQLSSNDGVILVPAFTGMGAPYWQPNARAAMFGLSRASGAAQLSRAALEAVCYQTHDLLAAMAKDGVSPHKLRIDGGMVNNNWLMQFLADIVNIPVKRPKIVETTALGAAFLAGLQAGIYADLNSLQQCWSEARSCEPSLDEALRERLLRRWHKAVELTLEFSA